MVTASPQRSSLAPYESYPLHQLLDRAAGRLPEKVALIDGERSFTYQQLSQLSERFAAGLMSLGVNRGDRVGILAPNCVEYVIAFLRHCENRCNSYHGQLWVPRAGGSPSAKRQRRQGAHRG